MLQHRGQAVGLAAALGQDIGKIGAPPHGQAAGAAAEKLFLVVIGQKGAELVDGVLCNAGSNVSGPLPQLLGKVGTALIDEIEIAVVLLHKADGQLFFFNIGQQRAQGGGVDVLAVDDLAIRHKAVLAVHGDIAVPVHLLQSGQMRQVHRRTARGDENFHAVGLQGVQRLHGGIRHFVAAEQQRAVDVKKGSSDVLIHVSGLSPLEPQGHCGLRAYHAG